MPSADGAAAYVVEANAETSGRRWPEAGCSRIPNWVYTDPEIFAREQQRIFEGAGWLYICLEAEIVKPIHGCWNRCPNSPATPPS
jgi:hypothetical protein